MTEDKTLAARFFFRNCAVSIHLPGEMRISHTLNPGPDDVVLDRDFTPANSQSEFIGGQSDFYRFLDASSSTNASIIKKTAAIGYMLCNKLPRGGSRCRAFFCVDEIKGACCNEKSIFAEAIAQLSNPVISKGSRYDKPFWLSNVSDSTNLLIIDNLPARVDLSELFMLCGQDWIILRKTQAPKIIELAKAPYVLITTSVPADLMPAERSFRRNFAVLDFSSAFGPDSNIGQHVGHLFHGWSNEQWHRFDNFMLYCVCEYLKDYSRGNDVFSFYE